MPIIRIEYDSRVASEDEIRDLADNIQVIVAEKTGIKEVFVYGNAPHICLKADPVEIFIEMTASKIESDTLFDDIKTALKEWKNQSGFPHPMNLTLTPMHWQLEIGI